MPKGHYMKGNLNASYMLRVDRLDRLRERFRRAEIHEQEFRELLAVEGIMSPAAQTAEILNSLPGMRPIGEAAGRIVEQIKPKGL